MIASPKQTAKVEARKIKIVMFKFFKKSKERLTILKDKQNPNSYENRMADFDKKCGLLLEKDLINPDFYFSSRKYYALKIYREDIVLVE